jgi:SP family galactose:H+ symporter-like MFS transporter
MSADQKGERMQRGLNSGNNSSIPPFVYVAAAISALGGLLFGYDTGVISGAILFIKQDFSLSSTLEEFVVSAVLIGAVLGAIVGGTLADRLGRRRSLLLSAAIFALGAFGTAFSPSVMVLIVGRVIVGVAIGAASFIAPMYISEVSPNKIRGRLVALNQIALTSGIVIAYLVDYALSNVQGWRWMLGLAAIPAAALGVGMVFMPNSPRWLVAQNDNVKANEVLKRIRSQGDVERELKEIQISLQKQTGGWTELKSPLIRPALVVGIGLAIFQQITGINTVIYYAPTIFQFAGFKSASAAILATVGVGVINVLMTVVAMQLLDRVGRRPLLLAGLIGMVVSLVVLGVAFWLPTQGQLVGWIAAISLAAYVGSFAIGLGPVFWLLISEIYPLSVRGLAMSIATVANWGSNLIVALTFLTLVGVLGRPGVFWLYGLIGIGAWFFAHSLVPETRGKSLEEIEEHWRSGKHPRQMGMPEA